MGDMAVEGRRADSSLRLVSMGRKLALACVCAAWFAGGVPLLADERAAAGAYRCVHLDGRVEYRTFPLQGVSCQPVEGVLQRSPSADPAAGTVDGGEKDGWVEHEADEDGETIEMRNCRQARANLEMLEGDGPLVITGDDGEQRLLGEEERAGLLARTRREAAYWCVEP